MLHNLLIAAHAALAVAAFFLGVIAVLRPAGQMSTMFRVYLAALWLMVLFLITVVLVDWTGLDPISRIVYSALLALAVYTGWRGWSAAQDLQNRAGDWQSAYIEDVGFTLIALFDGFVVVGSIDLGAPIALVVAIGVLGVAAGRYGIQRLKGHALPSSSARLGREPA